MSVAKDLVERVRTGAELGCIRFANYDSAIGLQAFD